MARLLTAQETVGGAPIRTGTTEVILDLVARDKRGRPLRELTKEDFQIMEGGRSFPPRAPCSTRFASRRR